MAPANELARQLVANGVPDALSASQKPTRVMQSWRTGDRVRWGGQHGLFVIDLHDGTHANIRIGHRLYRVRLADLSPD